MRKELKKLGENTRGKFKGEVVRRGVRQCETGYRNTLLIKNVMYGENLVADHVWLNSTYEIDNITLEEGSIIEFSATVSTYRRGNYKNVYRNRDYKLQNVRNVRVLDACSAQEGEFVLCT